MGLPRTVYFAMIDGQEVGPITRAEFALRLANAMVSADTYVWKQGMDEWMPAAKVEDLAGIFKAREQARKAGLRPPPPPAAAMAKGRPPPPPVALEPAREEEIELELDLPAAKSKMPPPPVAARPPPPPPAKPSWRDFDLAAPRSRPGQYKPPPPPPPKAPSIIVPPPPSPEQEMSEATPPLEEEDEHTTLDMLPLGERVHQEEIADSLFTTSGEHSVTSSGNTGAIPVDTLPFAQQKPNAPRQVSTSVRPSIKPSPPPPPEPEPPRRAWLMPAIIAGAGVAVALIAALAVKLLF